MELADGQRQIVAGLGASAVFLGAFFGLSLVWWAALGLAVPVYGALLLVVRRRPTPREEMVVDGVSRAELTEAIDAITDASRRMRQLALRA